MNAEFTIYAILLGIFIIAIDLILSIGMVISWRDGARVIPVAYAVTDILITAMYVDTIVRMCIE